MVDEAEKTTEEPETVTEENLAPLTTEKKT